MKTEVVGRRCLKDPSLTLQPPQYTEHSYHGAHSRLASPRPSRDWTHLNFAPGRKKCSMFICSVVDSIEYKLHESVILCASTNSRSLSFHHYARSPIYSFREHRAREVRRLDYTYVFTARRIASLLGAALTSMHAIMSALVGGWYAACLTPRRRWCLLVLCTTLTLRPWLEKAGDDALWKTIPVGKNNRV